MFRIRFCQVPLGPLLTALLVLMMHRRARPVDVLFSPGLQSNYALLHWKAIGLGCAELTTVAEGGAGAVLGKPLDDTLTPAAAFKLLSQAYAAGCRHFDTAEAYRTDILYGLPRDDRYIYSEAAMAPFLRSVPRKSFTVATKYMPALHGSQAGSYEAISRAVDASLARLGIGVIDLYYAHRTPSRTFLLDFMASMKLIVASGRVRYVGLSEIGPEALRQL